MSGILSIDQSAARVFALISMFVGAVSDAAEASGHYGIRCEMLGAAVQAGRNIAKSPHNGANKDLARIGAYEAFLEVAQFYFPHALPKMFPAELCTPDSVAVLMRAGAMRTARVAMKLRS